MQEERDEEECKSHPAISQVVNGEKEFKIRWEDRFSARDWKLPDPLLMRYTYLTKKTVQTSGIDKENELQGKRSMGFVDGENGILKWGNHGLSFSSTICQSRRHSFESASPPSCSHV